MEQTLSKNGMAIVLGLVLMFGLRWVGQHWMGHAEVLKASSYSYEMPRPKSYVGGFDLSGREIDREVLSDEELLAKAAKSGKTLDAVKKAAAKKAIAKKTTAANAKSKLDKSKLTVSTTDTSRSFGSLTVEDATVQKSETTAAAGSITAGVAAAPATPNNSDDQKKSAAEWMALLSNQPTAAVVAAFDAAHAQGDVSNADFYNIAFELLNSSSQQSQLVGAEVIQGDTSPAALLFLSAKYNQESVADQAILWKVMITFAQPTKFRGLGMALSSSDTNVIPLALKVLSIAVQAAQQGVGISSGSGRGVAGSVQPQSLLQFETDLAQIAKAGGANGQTAQALLNQIQNMNQGA